MKTLSFAPDQTLLYTYVYQCLNNPEYRLANRDEVRLHGKLCDLLESIGVRDENAGVWNLRPQGGAVHLESAQLQLLSKMIEASPPFTALSRKIAPIYDLIDQAPDYTPPPVAPLGLADAAPTAGPKKKR